MLRKLIVGVCGFVFMLAVGIAIADESKGKVKAVDADKKTITVTVGDKDVTFSAKDAKVTAGKKEIKLDDLKTGDSVTVTHEKDAASKIAKGKAK